MQWEKVPIRKLDAATKEANANFHFLTGFLALLPTAAFVEDKMGRLLYLNEQAQRDWKVRRVDAIGRTVASLVGGSSLDRAMAHNVADVLRDMSGRVFSHVSGNPHLFTLVFPVIDSHGEVLIAGLVVKST